MKKYWCVLCLLSLSLGGYGQAPGDIVIGRIDSIQSGILKETRQIWVHVPDGYAPDKKYPVLYLLDGDTHFFATVGVLNHLSQSNGNTVCPEMIVVGIPNTNRTRDLTPYKPDLSDPENAWIPPEMAEEAGGGEDFLAFVGKELIPYIEAHYPTTPYRMLVGHSLGGLTVLHTLLHHTDLFNAYVAIDPTANLVPGRLLREFKQASVSDKSFANKALFTGIANLDIGADLNETLADTTFLTEGLRANLEIDQFLKADQSLQLRYGSRFYENEIHPTVPLITEYDALHFIFDFYDLNLKVTDFEDPTIDLVAKLRTHYERVSQIFGYEVKPDESLVNSLGYQSLMMQQLDRAGGLFELNADLYPESSNVYDSLGDYYAAAGEKEKAVASYKKAQSIEYHDYTEEKLKQLTNE